MTAVVPGKTEVEGAVFLFHANETDERFCGYETLYLEKSTLTATAMTKIPVTRRVQSALKNPCSIEAPMSPPAATATGRSINPSSGSAPSCTQMTINPTAEFTKMKHVPAAAISLAFQARIKWSTGTK